MRALSRVPCDFDRAVLQGLPIRLLLALFLFLIPHTLAAQILETFPAHGSVQTGPCGPFGVRMGASTLADPASALTVRGSATGARRAGEWHVSAGRDTILFTPTIPFAPGEDVTITVGEGFEHTWRTLIRPAAEHRLTAPSELEERTVSLGEHFAPGTWEHLSWTWADLDGDHDQEAVLLLATDGGYHLLSVAHDQERDLWQTRAPVSTSTDNPLALLAFDGNGNSRQDLALLSLTGMLVWTDPGAATSPLGAEAVSLDFPLGFHARNFTRGDLDADGDEDLVVFGLFGLQYLVYLNQGAAGLVAGPVRTVAPADSGADKNLPWPVHVLLRDADGDGRPDLVWCADFQEQGTYRVRLARGRGDGDFDEAGILTETTAFPQGLVFGRLLDPWDDAPTGPVVAAAVVGDGEAELCTHRFDGTWPAAPLGCRSLPQLGTGSSPLLVGHALTGDGYPELWSVEKTTGRLQAVTLDAAPQVQSRDLGRDVATLAAGDFDFDGDLDLALPVPGQSALLLLETPGGAPPVPPLGEGPGGAALLDFGLREVACPEAALPLTLNFTNPGLHPARLVAVQLDDAAGVFSLGDVPAAWFGSGCTGPTATAQLPVNFAPLDTLLYTAQLAVELTWAGAAHDGGDSTLVSSFALRGRGGIYRLEDGGSGVGALFWTREDGPVAGGATLDFGPLPALAEVATSTTVQLVNTGHFPLQISLPEGPAVPFAVTPTGARSLAPGERAQWTVSVAPRPELVPAGEPFHDFRATIPWSVRSLAPQTCLPEQIIAQELVVRLLPADPRLIPDPDCSGVPAVAAAVDTLSLLEDGQVGYCVDIAGWDWAGAAPEVRVLENPFPWLELVPSEDHIEVLADLVGPSGGDVLLEVRDQNHPAIFRTFRLTLLVEPSRPDLAIVDMFFLPLEPGGRIQQQYPFYVDVVVEVTRESAEGALMELEGGPCTCPVQPLGKMAIDLVEGTRDTVRFVVESCGEGGECPFTACIEPLEGLDADFDPSNNCITLGAAVAANQAPGLEISNLVLTPEDPNLVPCNGLPAWNEIQDGMVQALGVREQNTLTFDVRSVDPDGDRTRLSVGLLPGFVSASAQGDTLVRLTVTPPEGTVSADVCEAFGPLAFEILEMGVAAPETSLVEIPLYVKWEGPDLQTRIINLPVTAGLAEEVRFNGQVRCTGYNSGPFSVEMWVNDPDGLRVAGRLDDYEALPAGQAITLAHILFTVERPGEYCAHIALRSGRDVRPENNSEVQCFVVDSGPFVVSPNVVTPNGDGHNDAILFHFLNQTMPAPMVRIFDLSGRLIHETSSLDAERRLVWDGRDDAGHVVPPGPYLYVVYDEGREFRTGTCGVVR